MAIDRSKLVEYLEYKVDHLQCKIDGYEEMKNIDSGMVLMWIAKKTEIIRLLDNLNNGTFDVKKPPSEL
ncbi:hypothetical protein [Paenibacillus harenae]|uniref:Pantothenate synthetase n=1 Tax=Paenibacillus harenae TaxID=306543 RepID=A0ABT9U411_PAEHA|nr:hypothetical protein [Paenibacillus harenae]MDQ0114379.1 pantothenate synthetase [Paenibacillus harenae]